MNNKVKKCLSIGLCIVGLNIFYFAVSVCIVLDPFGLFTVTAPELNRDGWSLVQVGMSKEDVVTLLGAPLMDQGDTFRYSLRRRWILWYRSYFVNFDAVGRVKSKVVMERCDW